MLQRLLFARIEVWVLVALLLIGFLMTILFGAVVLREERESGKYGVLGATSIAIAEIPDTVKSILKNKDRMLAHAQSRAGDLSGWSFQNAAAGSGISGYWLLSRFEPQERRSIIEMVRLSDGQVMHEWRPDVDSILATAKRTTHVANKENWTNGIFRYFSPLLLENGDLILKDSASPLFRVDACARPVWMQDATMFHHSTEPDGAGGFWIPSHIEPSKIPRVSEKFFDDALAHVSQDGKILNEISVAEILIRHGMQHVVFPPGVTNLDPIHLNDIEPVLSDGPFWRAGDLFLSLRHPAMIMLYRPSTDEIVWMQQGPWMAQHDVDIIDDSRISIYDNRAYFRGVDGRVDGTSDIVVYDFATKTMSLPHHQAMLDAKMLTLFEGVYAALPGGGFVAEDTPSGMLLLVGADGKKLGQFVNSDSDGKVYQIGWGRYVDENMGNQILLQIKGLTCDGE